MNNRFFYWPIIHLHYTLYTLYLVMRIKWGYDQTKATNLTTSERQTDFLLNIRILVAEFFVPDSYYFIWHCRESITDSEYARWSVKTNAISECFNTPLPSTLLLQKPQQSSISVFGWKRRGSLTRRDLCSRFSIKNCSKCEKIVQILISTQR